MIETNLTKKGESKSYSDEGLDATNPRFHLGVWGNPPRKNCVCIAVSAVILTLLRSWIKNETSDCAEPATFCWNRGSPSSMKKKNEGARARSAPQFSSTRTPRIQNRHRMRATTGRSVGTQSSSTKRYRKPSKMMRPRRCAGGLFMWRRRDGVLVGVHRGVAPRSADRGAPASARLSLLRPPALVPRRDRDRRERHPARRSAGDVRRDAGRPGVVRYGGVDENPLETRFRFASGTAVGTPAHCRRWYAKCADERRMRPAREDSPTAWTIAWMNYASGGWTVLMAICRRSS